jgi:hypothetical protein
MVAAAEARLRQTAAILAKLEAGARPEQLAQAEAAAEQARQQYNMAVDLSIPTEEQVWLPARRGKILSISK